MGIRGAFVLLYTAGLAGTGCIIDDKHQSRWQPTPADEAFLDSVLALVEPCCVSSGMDLDPSRRREVWKAVRLLSGFSRDESLRSACIAELEQLAGTPNCVPLLGDFDDVCVRVFTERSGPVQPGWSCGVPADCAGSPNQLTTCLQNPGWSKCVSLARGEIGSQPCAGESLTDGQILLPLDPGMPSRAFYCDIKDGLYCEMTTKACATLLDGGSPCTWSKACASWRCLESSATCAPVVTTGEACAEAVCTEGTRCNPLSSVCVERLAAGSVCTGADKQCLGSCNISTRVCSPVTFEQEVAFDLWCI